MTSCGLVEEPSIPSETEKTVIQASGRKKERNNAYWVLSMNWDFFFLEQRLLYKSSLSFNLYNHTTNLSHRSVFCPRKWLARKVKLFTLRSCSSRDVNMGCLPLKLHSTHEETVSALGFRGDFLEEVASRPPWKQDLVWTWQGWCIRTVICAGGKGLPAQRTGSGKERATSHQAPWGQ